MERFRKSHCINGHEYTKENSVFTSQGNRICRTCRNQAQAKYRIMHPVPTASREVIELAPGTKAWHCRADHDTSTMKMGPDGSPWCIDCYNEWSKSMSKNKPVNTASSTP